MATQKRSAKKEAEKTICIECKFYRKAPMTQVRDPLASHQCGSPKAPVTGFILGTKECKSINDGNCAFYESAQGA